MKFLFLLNLVVVLSLTGCAEMKAAGKDLGQGARGAAREIGHGTRDAAKEIGHGSKRVIKSITDDESND